MQLLFSNNWRILFLFTLKSFRALSRSICTPFVRIFVDCRRLYMIIGHMTLSSNWLFCAEISIVLSFPRTWAQIISTHSKIEGFTFPGMMDEPGWTAGRVISLSPACGPEFIILRSLEMFSRLIAKERSAAETLRKAFMLLAISVEFFAFLKWIPVSFERFLIIRFLNLGSLVIPVPTAVPPIPITWRFFASLSMNF